MMSRNKLTQSRDEAATLRGRSGAAAPEPPFDDLDALEQPTPHELLARRFLFRYGQFIRELAESDKFEVLNSMPEFQRYVRDTEDIFREYERSAGKGGPKPA